TCTMPAPPPPGGFTSTCGASVGGSVLVGCSTAGSGTEVGCGGVVSSTGSSITTTVPMVNSTASSRLIKPAARRQPGIESSRTGRIGLVSSRLDGGSTKLIFHLETLILPPPIAPDMLYPLPEFGNSAVIPHVFLHTY